MPGLRFQEQAAVHGARPGITLVIAFNGTTQQGLPRRLTGVAEMVLSLYAKRLATGGDLGAIRRDIRAAVSRETMSRNHQKDDQGDARPGNTSLPRDVGATDPARYAVTAQNWQIWPLGPSLISRPNPQRATKRL